MAGRVFPLEEIGATNITTRHSGKIFPVDGMVSDKREAVCYLLAGDGRLMVLLEME